MKITIAHITSRLDPKWDWFVDAICNQATPEELAQIDFLFIDRHAWSPMARSRFSASEGATETWRDTDRAEKIEAVVRGRFDFRHLPPLPNQYQGPFKLTKRDWFNAGVNRNTAIVAARGDYVMFCDDLALPMPGWWNAVKRGAQNGWLLAGQYKKVTNLLVANGQLISHSDFPQGVDSRWTYGSETGPVAWHGSGVYGCSFGAPLESLLGCDGNGIECCGQGGEDYDLGMRLARSGLKVMLDRTCLTLESEEAHHIEPSLPRERKIVMQSALPVNYRQYQIAREAEMYWSDHVVLNRLANETARITPIFANDLRKVRDYYQTTGKFLVPTEPLLDWRTGEPMSEL